MACQNFTSVKFEPQLKKKFVSGAMRIRENTEFLQRMYGHLDNPENIHTSFRTEGGCGNEASLSVKYVDKPKISNKNATLFTMLSRGQATGVLF